MASSFCSPIVEVLMVTYVQKVCQLWLICIALFLTACGQETGADITSELSNQDSAVASTPDTGSQPDIAATETSPEELTGTLTVGNIYGDDAFLSERVASFGMNNPSCVVTYSDCEGEDYAKRILADVMSGGGPDVLLLDRSDLWNLVEQDAIATLGGMLSNDDLGMFWSGAVEAGSKGGHLYALPKSIFIRTLIVNSDYMTDTNWNTEDVHTVVDNNPGLKGLFIDCTGQENYTYNLRFLIGLDIANSPFMSGENCRFDSPEFRQLLTFVKDMTGKGANTSTPDDRTAPITSGEYLGAECMIYSLDSYADIEMKLGDKANWVGFPSAAGGSVYLQDYGMIAVNTNAEAKPEVRAFIQYLYSEESQERIFHDSEISVRMDIPDRMITYSDFGDMYFWSSENNHGFQLEFNPDETPYLEGYKALLARAVPYDYKASNIFDIIMDEAMPYFEDDKDLDEVVDIIQNRMQVYQEETFYDKR